MEHKLSSEDIEKIKDGRAILLDVRSEDELAEKSCKLAHHWDVQQMSGGRFPNIPKDLPIFVFCRSSNRSALAQMFMTQAHFTDVHNVGGINRLPEELC